MHLLVVTRERPGDARFGLGKAIRAISAQLRERGHRIDIVTAADWSAYDEASFAGTLKWLDRSARHTGFTQAPTAALAERWVQAARALQCIDEGHHTHVWFQDPWLAAAYLIRKRLRRGAQSPRWGVSEHGLGSFAQAVLLDGLHMDDRSMRWLLRVERWVLARADFVLTPTNAAHAHLMRDLCLARAPTHWHVVGYGLPDTASLTRAEARAALGWPEDIFHVLVLGRVAPVKRLDIIIDACVAAQRTVPKLQLVVVGGTLDGALATRASALARPPLCLLAEDPRFHLAAADMYVSACAVESYGLANLEAIAAGLPSVVAAGGGALEILGDGACFVPACAQAFARAIERVANEPALRERMATAASARAGGHPRWRELTTVYENVIAGGHE